MNTGFKYNDKLVIKDRDQMEDLFKYRLGIFDQNRVKNIKINNDINTPFYVIGKFTKGILNIKISQSHEVSDICMKVTPKGICNINLIEDVEFSD